MNNDSYGWLIFIFIVVIAFAAISNSKNNSPPAKWQQYAYDSQNQDINSQSQAINNIINALKVDIQENKVERSNLINGVDVIGIKMANMQNLIAIEYHKAEEERKLAAKERIAAQKDREIAAEERDKQFSENIKWALFGSIVGWIFGFISPDKAILAVKSVFSRNDEQPENISFLDKVLIGLLFGGISISILMSFEYLS